MDKRGKGIQFGKIKFNVLPGPPAPTAMTEIPDDEAEEAGGFGKFSASASSSSASAIAAQEELDGMQKLMGFSGFGKKAKQFNLEEMVQQARKTAQDKTVVEKFAPLKLQDKKESDDEEEFIGPPIPKDLPVEGSESKKADDEDDSDDEVFGPLPPRQEPSGADNSDDESEDEDESLVSKIPASHEVQMQHGSKAVLALAVDPAGARMASGSMDYEVKFWDFQGMDNTCQSFRTMTPCENHPIKYVQYSMTGDLVLIISGNCQAKVLDRDGFEKAEYVKGDMYITDMANTKGHTASLTSGVWHPRIREEFLTAAEDSTLRIWNMWKKKSQMYVIKCRAQNGLKTNPISCTYSRDGNLVACACNDGSILMWDHRKAFVNTAKCLRKAHENQTETSSITFSYGEQMLATRGGDDTLKLWDLRLFKKPVHVAEGLFSRYSMTECSFSPNDSMVITGISMEKGEKEGKLVFFDKNTFEKVQELSVTNSHVIRAIWHQKLNQILIGCGNGIVKAYYDDKKSFRGAMLCANKTRRKVKDTHTAVGQQIITPHALPLFRKDRPKSLKKQMEKARLDPVKSRRPELPLIAKGQGGRVATGGGTLSSYVIRNLGISKRVEDDQDPREAILRFAKDAAENPYWIAPAYKKNQPVPIFQSPEEEEEDDEEPTSKKQKV